MKNPPVEVQSTKVASLENSVSDDKDEVCICLGGEICTVCGEKCKTVRSLQEHIVKKHCTVSKHMLELLKM